ncbi:SPOR domain-containing protein [Oceaniovalibus sp. ACAM 378]|uniref:SPOR domain-containing protein n=1 Tax=Oceaniovalibus sp. ACAM 378 TaxID=2599923 RepID=UPI0021037851|nr:SPOR domain-containing protein [Oceaniovalibus sp. ACAM 378]
MKSSRAKLAMLAGVVSLIAACEDGFKFPMSSGAESETGATGESDGSASRTTRLVERDIEAPEVFQVTEAGLWDGRPSLGGVWVAHSDVKDPERVIIRNEANQKFVIGALFRRERDNPGPRIQVSSDAAEALGLLAGQPGKLNVTALRREEVSETPEPAAAQALATLEKPEEIEALSLDSPSGVATATEGATIAAAAGAAIDRPAPKPAATAVPRPSRPASTIKDPYIQIGIFSVKTNAENTATALRGAGMIPAVDEQTTKGKTFYRVVVGPATTNAEKTALLKKVKGLGFTDAYFIAN